METTKLALVLGLTGAARSGKDTVFSLFKELLPKKTVVRVAFGDEIKKEYAESLGMDVDFLERNKSAHRIGLQRWGTEFRRDQDEDYWISKVEPQVDFLRKSADLIVITDVRFLNEENYIKENLGGSMIKVQGHPDRVLCSLHESEVEMHGIRPDWILPNTGTHLDLKHGIRFLIQENNLHE